MDKKICQYKNGFTKPCPAYWTAKGLDGRIKYAVEGLPKSAESPGLAFELGLCNKNGDFPHCDVKKVFDENPAIRDGVLGPKLKR